jgi:formylglycine-generating enzyme required for sulfatase activity
MPLTELARVPAGELPMGASSKQIEACIANLATRLVDPSDDLARFRHGILKEHPRRLARVASFRLGRYPVTHGSCRGSVSLRGLGVRSLRHGA